MESGTRTVEETMDALADDRRRELLAFLLERDGEGTVEVSALADRMSNGAEDADEDGSDERISTRLRHVHLPRLADAGIVSYDRSAETVRLADGAALIEDALDAAETLRD